MSTSRWGNQPTPSKEEIKREREEEKAEREGDKTDIDGDINWAYSEMRIIEAWLEQAIEERGASLTEHDQKRIDKALVLARTGMKMLKKVVKTRAPHLDTAAWKTERPAGSA